MRKRRPSGEAARWHLEADGDLAKGLREDDVRRNLGVARTTYYRWRRHHDPAQAWHP